MPHELTVVEKLDGLTKYFRQQNLVNIVSNLYDGRLVEEFWHLLVNFAPILAVKAIKYRRTADYIDPASLPGFVL